MSSNTKLGTNFGCEVWLPAHFPGKTSKVSVLFSHRSSVITGAASLERGFFFFSLNPCLEAKEKYRGQGILQKYIFLPEN